MKTMDPTIPLILSLFAGLSTGIGSSIAFFMKKMNFKILSFSLAVSAGVMIYVSFMELLVEANHIIGEGYVILIFFVGMMFMWIIDRILPELKNPHHPLVEEDFACLEEEIPDGPQPKAIHVRITPKEEQKGENEPEEERGKQHQHGKHHKDFIKIENLDHDHPFCKGALYKTGYLTALALAIHNFPEGMITFASGMDDIRLGIVMTIAIAIHNIPEGISVSMPIYYSTGNKKLAFKYSFLSGLAEPLGALLTYLILMPFLNEQIIHGMMAFVAGVMIYISFDELIPSAHEYGAGPFLVIGTMVGMGIMALSLLLI